MIVQRILERLGGTAANLTSQAIEAIRGLTGLSERVKNVIFGIVR